MYKKQVNVFKLVFFSHLKYTECMKVVMYMKKGFTLIELLAVIVILAIIALIATPIVRNIIEDAKISATLRTADFYLDGVEMVVSTLILKDDGIPNGTYGILENGNICLEKYNLVTKTCEDRDSNLNNNEVIVEVKGEKPSGGTITIINGEISDIALSLNDKVVVKNENGELTFGKLKMNLASYIKDLYSETTIATVNKIEYSLDETHSLMNDRLGSSKVAKTDGNIRYYGANPKNYIDIGDRDADGNIIFWRIIGVFKGIEVTDEEGNVIKTEDLVKIIRSDILSSGKTSAFSWDYKYDGSTANYTNDWKSSTLNTLLNNAYYNSQQTSYYNNSITPTTLDFSSTGLSNEARNKAERVKWGLGPYQYSSVYTNVMYGYESAGTNTWSGKIALMSPSDYGYASDLSNCQMTLVNYNDSNCKLTNWIYYPISSQWTLISFTNTQGVFYLLSGDCYGRAHSAVSVRPVMYLKSNVNIVEEKETSTGIKYYVVE